MEIREMEQLCSSTEGLSSLSQPDGEICIAEVIVYLFRQA